MCGFTHRDIQPKNFVLDEKRSDIIYIINFGFAQPHTPEAINNEKKKWENKTMDLNFIWFHFQVARSFGKTPDSEFQVSIAKLSFGAKNRQCRRHWILALYELLFLWSPRPFMECVRPEFGGRAYESFERKLSIRTLWVLFLCCFVNIIIFSQTIGPLLKPNIHSD